MRNKSTNRAQGDGSRPASLVRRQWVYLSLLAFGGTLTSAGAFALRDMRVGNAPAAASPGGLLAIAAALCVGTGLAVVWTRAGRRMDTSFATDSSALLVVGGLTSARVKQALSKILSEPPRYLPTRVSIVATATGLELWGRPRQTTYVEIAWAEIESISVTKLTGPAGTFTGLKIDLGPARPSLDMRITGFGVTGLSSVEGTTAQALAEELTALKSSVTAA